MEGGPVRLWSIPAAGTGSSRTSTVWWPFLVEVRVDGHVRLMVGAGDLGMVPTHGSLGWCRLHQFSIKTKESLLLVTCCAPLFKVSFAPNAN